MSDQALILRDDRALSCNFTAQAFVLKNAALDLSATVGRVDTAEQNEAAVKAQIEIARVLKLAEEARAAAKAPILKFGKAIDGAHASFVEDLKSEERRLMELTGSYQQLEQAKARAAAKAEQDRLTTLEKEKAQAQAKATSHEELEAIADRFNDRIAAEAPKPVAPPKADGQVVKNDWDFEVTDIALLAKAHWNLVTVEPKRGDIKALLRQGIKVAGIRAWPVVKAGVRLAPERPAIEV